MFIHNLIKIKLSTHGYLPDYPYHMISDAEMCKAFMSCFDSTGYFYDMYPCIDSSLTSKYKALEQALSYYMSAISTQSDIAIPDWVYSYMLGNVISINSDYKDIYDLATYLGISKPDVSFDVDMATACYDISSKWLAKSQGHIYDNTNTINLRPPTIFGEPHVIKSLRINAASV